MYIVNRNVVYRQRGFTLVELLVVLAIIGILSSMIIAAVNQARESARVATGKSFASHVQRTRGDTTVGQWDFEESGTAALDMSGGGRNITLSANATRITGPLSSGALDFSFVNLATPGTIGDFSTNTMKFGSDWTMAAWVKIKGDTLGTAQIFFSTLTASPANPVYIAYTANGLNTFYVSWSDGTVRTLLAPNNTAQLNKWHHVAVTHQNSNSTTILYVDGREVARDSTHTSLAGNARYIAVGSHIQASCGASSYCPLWGSVDDARMYNATLLSSDMHKMYADGAPNHAIAIK